MQQGRRRSRPAVFAAALALSAAASPANAEILKNLKVSGQLDLQATSATNVLDFTTRGAGFNDRIGDVQTRLMVHADWDILDDVHAKVSFTKNDRSWGTIGANQTATQAKPTSQNLLCCSGDGEVISSFFVDQANFKVDKVAGLMDLTFGRQFYGDSGDAVIYYGPSDKAWYGLPVSALDAARLDWGGESYGLSGLAGKQTGGKVGFTDQADVDVMGLNFAIKPSESLNGRFYVWNRLTHATGALGSPPALGSGGGKNDNLYVAGVRLKAAAAGFWVKGEFDQNFGENRVRTSDLLHAPDSHYDGYALLGDLGWKHETENAGMFSLWGTGALGSGRQSTLSNVNDGFQAISPDFRPGSVYGRFAPMFFANGACCGGSYTSFGGLGSSLGMNADNPAGSQTSLNNRVIVGGGLKMSPAFANKLVAGLSWWDYRLHRFNLAPGAAKPYNGNRHIGSEFDADLVWNHSENVAFAAGWGTFQPGGLIQNILTPGTNNPATLVYFDTRVKF